VSKRKKGHAGGGHGWFVTFADLMGPLMAFFVMLTAYSTMDQKKLQMVAGSMAQAFGVLKESRFSGVVEIDGVPTRPNLKNVEHVDVSQASDKPAPRLRDVKLEGSTEPAFDATLSSAAASIRQALQASPELSDLANNLRVEETPEGLSVELVDQDGRSMFPGGSSSPNARTLNLLAAVAPVLSKLPNKVVITGHTAWSGISGRSKDGDGDEAARWRLSAARALAVREALAASGVAEDRFAGVVGKADSEPLIADDPSMSVNRRVSILLLKGAAPLPEGLRP
jgi:chemotaxis protein MotB